MTLYCLGIYDSGNYAYRICTIFEKSGYVFEVVSIPCRIAKTGCGHCLKFSEEYLEMIVDESKKNKIPVREAYRIIPQLNKNKYEKIDLE